MPLGVFGANIRMTSEKTHLLAEDVETSHEDSSSNQASRTTEPGSSDSSPPAPSKWTRKQMLIAISLSLMNVSLCISFGIISPFYPAEAKKKGATETEVGLVFGVFQLIMFLVSPIYGAFISKIGAKFMFLSGSFILGGCSICFGFLDRCPSGAVYVAMCFVCRSVEANGCAMLATASFAIMAKTFPNNVGQAIGTLEIFSGIGMVLGPSIGGGLYGIGGYLLPFVVIGGLVWATTIVSYFVLPTIEEVPKMSGSILSLLKIPGCLIIFIVVVGCGLSLSFLDPTFSPWMLKAFPGITVPQIGLIFMVSPAVYALSAPFSGYISDKGYQGSTCIVGMTLTGISFLLLGPSPMFSSFLPTTIPFTIMALIILGISIGAGMIPVFPLIIRLVRNKGFEDNLQTYGLVSGFFQSGFSLGGFVGPSAAGYFTGKFGFEWSVSIAGFLNIGLAGVMMVYIILMRVYGKWPVPVDEEMKAKSEQNGASASSPTSYGSVNA